MKSGGPPGETPALPAPSCGTSGKLNLCVLIRRMGACLDRCARAALTPHHRRPGSAAETQHLTALETGSPAVRCGQVGRTASGSPPASGSFRSSWLWTAIFPLCPLLVRTQSCWIARLPPQKASGNFSISNQGCTHRFWGLGFGIFDLQRRRRWAFSPGRRSGGERWGREPGGGSLRSDQKRVDGVAGPYPRAGPGHARKPRLWATPCAHSLGRRPQSAPDPWWGHGGLLSPSWGPGGPGQVSQVRLVPSEPRGRMCPRPLARLRAVLGLPGRGDASPRPLPPLHVASSPVLASPPLCHCMQDP